MIGSGFTPNKDAGLFINHVESPASHFATDTVSFKIPKSKFGDNYFGSVSLDVTLNGVDFTSFDDGFQYYQQPIVTGVYPKYGPIGG